MANYCFFTMYAEGKPESIDELVARMVTEYDHDKGVGNRPHFWGVFGVDVDDKAPRTEGTRLVEISGQCPWSVWSCMTDGEDSVARSKAEDPKLAPYCTSLKKTANEFGIEIEVFSDEPTGCVEEHFHYSPNGLSVEEWCEYEEIDWDSDEYPTFADLDAEYDLTEQGIKEDDYCPDETIKIGGYDDLVPFCYPPDAASE